MELITGSDDGSDSIKADKSVENAIYTKTYALLNTTSGHLP